MKNDLNGGISSVRPIPSFNIIEIFSGVTNALAITSPSLFFLIWIDSNFSSLTSIFSSSGSFVAGSVDLGKDEALVKLEPFKTTSKEVLAF